MGTLEKKLQQCRRPTGEMGKEVALSMNISHRELTSWGLSKVSIDENYIILDIGCGGGKTVNELAEIAREGKIHAIDYSPDCVDLSRQVNADYINAGKVEIEKASVSSLPFDDEKFDLVTAVETYYFWPDLINDLREILRVLKPAGNIVLINEIYKSDKFEERNRQLSQEGNFPYHTPEEFKEFLVKAGYSSVEIAVLEDKNWIFVRGSK